MSTVFTDLTPLERPVSALLLRPDPVADGLRALVELRRTLDAVESRLVVVARNRGYTWSEVSTLLELTPEGARKRHRAVDPRPRRQPSRRMSA